MIGDANPKKMIVMIMIYNSRPTSAFQRRPNNLCLTARRKRQNRFQQKPGLGRPLQMLVGRQVA